jgi:hypothetical protein
MAAMHLCMGCDGINMHVPGTMDSHACMSRAAVACRCRAPNACVLWEAAASKAVQQCGV